MGGGCPRNRQGWQFGNHSPINPNWVAQRIAVAGSQRQIGGGGGDIGGEGEVGTASPRRNIGGESVWPSDSVGHADACSTRGIGDTPPASYADLHWQGSGGGDVAGDSDGAGSVIGEIAGGC